MSVDRDGEALLASGPVGRPAWEERSGATVVAFAGQEVRMTDHLRRVELQVDEGEHRSSVATAEFEGERDGWGGPPATVRAEGEVLVVQSQTSLGLWEQRWGCRGGETLGAPWEFPAER